MNTHGKVIPFFNPLKPKTDALQLCFNMSFGMYGIWMLPISMTLECMHPQAETQKEQSAPTITEANARCGRPYLQRVK